MKRISVFVLVLTLLGALLLPCAAAPSTHVSLSGVTLSDEEAQTLETLAQTIEDNFGIEAFFYYDGEQEGGDAFQAAAQKFLRSNAATQDATLFAVSQTTYYIYSVGEAKSIVSNDDADTLYEAIKYSDEHGEIYNAAAHYFAALQALLAQRVGLSLAGGTSTTAAAPQTTTVAATQAQSAGLTYEQAQKLVKLQNDIQETYGVEGFFLRDESLEGGDEFTDYVKGYLKEKAQTDDATVFAVSKTSYYVYSIGKAKSMVSNDDADTLFAAVKDADARGDDYQAAVQYYKALPTILAQSTPSIPTEIASERAQRLYDGADLLSDEEEAALLEQLNTRSEELQFDIVVVTAKSIGARSPQVFAEDYYDYNGFGYGDSHDGCLLLISMADRDWWSSAFGYGVTALDYIYFIDYLGTDHFYSALKDGDYNDCFNRYVELVGDFVVEARENKPFSPSHRYNDAKNKIIGVIISLIIGLIIGAIVTFSKRKSYVAEVHKQAGAGDYLVNGSLQITQRDDRFVNTYVDRTRRVQESSSSGGGGGGSSSHSSPHTSSSGRSYTSGGGGKF